MRYSPAIYAKALLGVLKQTPEGKKDKVLRRFLKVLYKNSDQRMLVRIADAVEYALFKKNGLRRVKIEFAQKPKALAAAELKSGFSGRDKITERINPELIAGVRINIDGDRELDNSFRYKIKKIFK